MSRPTHIEIGTAIELERKHVGRLIKNGSLPKDGTLAEYIIAYIRYLRSQTYHGSNDAAVYYNEERALLTKQQRIGQELKNAQLRKELAPIEFISAVLAKAATQIKATLQTLPGQIRKKVPRMTATELTIVDRCTTRCLNTIANLPAILDDIIEEHEEGT